MADSGMRRVIPSDLYPLVLGFLRDNQLSEVANKFTQQDSNASSLLDIYSFWLKRGGREEKGCSGSFQARFRKETEAE
uniref:LisH domain-containing protein n=1 Tax=Sciurus vulgaris TaxID=55149 RepID=A0A8D2BAP4_SCIVU